jgi:cytochrome c oxidase cbb3-type subunit III
MKTDPQRKLQIMAKKPKEGDVGTTGHAWDGIEEWNNPLPRWWVYVFYLTILWGIGYTIAYPAWPLISGATQGITGWTAREEVAADIARADAANADIRAGLEAADMTTVAADPELFAYAQNAGASVFRTNCATCHGAGAGGVQASGYPNLLDDDWLWGGDIEAILTTIRHGIRNQQDPDARYSEMPAFGRDGILAKAEIEAVVEHVLAISGQEHDVTLAGEGSQLFADNCAACHSDTGAGNRDLGAPNLTDAIWLYGGTREDIGKTIYSSRFGVMPPWAPRLTEAEMRAVALWVHSRGGGE